MTEERDDAFHDLGRLYHYREMIREMLDNLHTIAEKFAAFDDDPRWRRMPVHRMPPGARMPSVLGDERGEVERVLQQFQARLRFEMNLVEQGMERVVTELKDHHNEDAA
jgi:hypothetical protein